jgi:hypothetical protein
VPQHQNPSISIHLRPTRHSRRVVAVRPKVSGFNAVERTNASSIGDRRRGRGRAPADRLAGDDRAARTAKEARARVSVPAERFGDTDRDLLSPIAVV